MDTSGSVPPASEDAPPPLTHARQNSSEARDVASGWHPTLPERVATIGVAGSSHEHMVEVPPPMASGQGSTRGVGRPS